MNMFVGNVETARELDGFELKLTDRKKAISVVGLGYVGAVSLACLSDLGHRVVGTDIDGQKVESSISWGESPIHEDRLGELLTQGVADDLLSATTDLKKAVYGDGCHIRFRRHADQRRRRLRHKSH